ncbi:MAG: hypothetical protein WA160_08885 [Pseudobdellovibrio sp.]
MDRVLLLFEDVGYASHIEKTLRKVGFDTETIANEYNLNEKILGFNPDFIIVKGGPTSRVSSLQVGKKLKESIKFNGKIILIFPEDAKPANDDLIKLRMDLLMIEPVSALRLAAHLLSLSGGNHDSIMDKLLRIAHTDPQFRQNEQQILKHKGESVETEIQLISDKLKIENPAIVVIDENSIQSFINPPVKKEKASVDSEARSSAQFVPGGDVDPDFKLKIQDQLKASDKELPLRIETYNQVISTIDQDLKKGLSKRQTKKRAQEISEMTSPEEKMERDLEKRSFVNALLKKK